MTHMGGRAKRSQFAWGRLETRHAMRNKANSGRGPADGNSAKQTQFREPASRLKDGLCKTKPKLGGIGYVGNRHRRCEAVPGWSGTCETKPIPADGPAVGRAHYRIREGSSCETKPIGARRGQGRDALATNALRRHYERGLLRETKPIPARCLTWHRGLRGT